jgi:two-component system chemotaxis response regulator CheB
VDDSAVMRSLLRSVVGLDKRLEVVATASDGASALRILDTVRPDCILLDVEMPVMDGLSTLKAIKASGRRVPVIMCSALTQRGAKVTIEALAMGAADVVAKPSGQNSREAATKALADSLIPKILALTATPTAPVLQMTRPYGTPSSGSSVGSAFSPAGVSAPPAPGRSVFGNAFGGPPPPAASNAPQANQPITSNPAVLLIGVSTGGPAALDVILPLLPANFPLPVLVVQHMPELFTRLLAERLDGRCPLHVTEATEGVPVTTGNIYIAKGDWHMSIADRRASGPPTLHLTQDAPENHCRPAVDVLFRSAVAVYGSRILSVILTGMGSDGLLGCRLIREHNGTVLAQDQQTSAVWGMPGAVAQAGLAHRVLPLNAIAPEILRLAGRGQREAIELRESAV